MDIAALSVITSQIQARQDAGVAILRKAIDIAEQGNNLVDQMLEKMDIPAGNNPSYMGNNIDIYV